MDDWKTSVLLGWPIFKGYVSFREGICSPRNPNFAHSYPNDSSILSQATGHTARPQDQRCAWNGDLAHQPVATAGRTKAKDPNLATVADDVFRLNGAGDGFFNGRIGRVVSHKRTVRGNPWYLTWCFWHLGFLIFCFIHKYPRDIGLI